ncbi:hypothetical protein EYR41_008710 [Orbilia oligospora]|uniref:Uncharacterized protein n=1 Tax=Orbilia oligospora TaxID=2813651 RepID=A0A7C8TZJ3_ORBOL|nr:hypothetical protein TWF751_002342 [Orbilia oligospora]TGJ67134.1 hypothetical protein EYR41_008710 [Orbilia oligospora]
MSNDPKTLYTLPITATSGTITITVPRPQTHPTVYLLTFVSPPDNRLLTSFIETFTLALALLRTNHPHGVLITTSGNPKFYSNGLNLEHVASQDLWWSKIFWPFMKNLLTYPMPTVALINGHAFAGGFITSMCHDYRVMNPSKGFLCMNELEFGAPLIPPLTSIFRNKLSAKTYRSIVLEAHRFTGPQALKEDIVDALGALEETFKLIDEKKLDKKAKSGIYSVIRRETWRETFGFVKGDDKECYDGDKWVRDTVKEAEREEEEAKQLAQRWEKTQGAKL